MFIRTNIAGEILELIHQLEDTVNISSFELIENPPDNILNDLPKLLYKEGVFLKKPLTEKLED